MDSKYDLIMLGDKLEPYWLNILLKDAGEEGLIYVSRIDNSIVLGNILFKNISSPHKSLVLGKGDLTLDISNLFSIEVMIGEKHITIYHEFFGWMYPITFKAVRETFNFIMRLHEIMKNKSKGRDIKFEDGKDEVSDFIQRKELLDSFELGFKIEECSEDQYINNVDNPATDQWGGAGPDCCTELVGGQHKKESSGSILEIMEDLQKRLKILEEHYAYHHHYCGDNEAWTTENKSAFVKVHGKIEGKFSHILKQRKKKV